MSSESSAFARSPSPSMRERQHRPEDAVGVLAAVLAHARPDRPGCTRDRDRPSSKGGAQETHEPVLGAHQLLLRRAHRAAARAPRSPTPAMTAHDCAIASMRHSSLSCEPSGVPSSKYARRYHAPSHACSSAARPSLARAPGASSARSWSPRASATRREIERRAREEPREPDALALRRASPTRFMPSFQSPPPIIGRPCGPERGAALERARRSARRACRLSCVIAGTL